MYPIAILAGGLGTRLGDLTRDVPKCLVRVAGASFLYHVLELLQARGIERVVMCVGHMGKLVEIVIGDGLEFGLQIEYSYDGSEQLGTAGAIRKALPLLGDDFFVLHGDSYLPCDMAAVQVAYKVSGCQALMAVCEPPEGYRPNVWLANRRVRAYDKHIQTPEMQHIDYGLGIYNRGAFRYTDEPDLSDLLTPMADFGYLAGYDVGQRFHTIGTPAGLAETQEFLASFAVR